MTDEIEVPEKEESEEVEPEYFPTPCSLVEGDVSIPDVDLMAEALERFGVVALAWRNLQDGELECLLASDAGFKWASIESIGKRGNIRAMNA